MGGPICAVVVAGLVAALVGVLLVGGEDATASEQPRAGSSATYADSVAPSIARLTDSAIVTGGALARAADARDLARIGRTATQQLAVVQAARARIAGLSTVAGERAARGALGRATQAHRGYLSSLARLPSLASPDARGLLVTIRAQARLAPHPPPLAIGAKEHAELEARAAEEAAVAAAAEEARQSSVVTSDPGGPSISRVSAIDRGGPIGMSFADALPLGDFSVVVVVDNLTNAVSGRGTGWVSVID